MVDWHADETGPPRRSADDYGFFRNTDWRNWNNPKNLFHTIVILSLPVLSFVEVSKANGNVFTSSVRYRSGNRDVLVFLKWMLKRLAR